VEIPSVAYSTDNTAYAKGALELLGSYQLTSGFVTGDLPPQDDLSPSKPSGSTGSYSADYSIYWLLGLADYYLYSGDTAFVTASDQSAQPVREVRRQRTVKTRTQVRKKFKQRREGGPIKKQSFHGLVGHNVGTGWQLIQK